MFVSERMERLQVERHVGYDLNDPMVDLVLGEDGPLFYWMDGAVLAVDGEAERWCGLVDLHHICTIYCLHALIVCVDADYSINVPGFVLAGWT